MTDFPNPIVIAVNARFVPDSLSARHAVGASGFALAAADRLARRHAFGGFIQYRRDEHLSRPVLRPGVVGDFPSVELRFNFGMRPALVREALAVAAASLTSPDAARARMASSGDRPIVYHQSSTLLPFQPRGWPFVVTHHGPFAEEVCRLFGRDFAIEAFRGGEHKLDHLIALQAHGLRVLRRAQFGIALEMGGVQERYLLGAGVPRERVFRIAPPWEVSEIAAPLDDDSDDRCHRCERGARADHPGTHEHGARRVRLLTMAARADAFKNLPLLIAAANALARHGWPVHLSIFAGAGDDERVRASLLNLVAEPLRAWTRVAPCLSHAHLVDHLRRERTRSVFVCTSVYETFGLTPLEAILAGMITLIPNLPDRIGMLDYVLPESRYAPTLDGLVTTLTGLLARPDFADLRLRQRAFATPRIASMDFASTVQAALTRTTCRAELLSMVHG